MKKKLLTPLIIISTTIAAGITLFSGNCFALSSETPSMLSSSLRMIWGLLVVLGILLVIYALMRRRLNFIQGGGKGLIKVIETRHLMPKKTLYLVEVRGQEYLLGAGSDTLELISKIDEHASSTFENYLKSSNSDTKDE